MVGEISQTHRGLRKHRCFLEQIQRAKHDQLCREPAEKPSCGLWVELSWERVFLAHMELGIQSPE